MLLSAPASKAQSVASPAAPDKNSPEKVIIDTDIGDDIDDAFAVALALRSPELQILGITTTFGDTETRAKVLDRFLAEAGRQDVPVAAGTPTPPKGTFTQRRYAENNRFAKPSHPDAVAFLLDQIRRNPGQITLIAIGPLMNVGAAIDKDPATFRRGYGDLGFGPPTPPEPEWNILNDIPSAQKLFAAGVPLFVMPLDATQLKLDEVKRAFLFSQGTPLTDALTLLYHQWGQQTPTLFDPMTIAFLVNPALCPVQPMHIRVDDKGFTRADPGPSSAPNPSNTQVCLDSNPEAFFRFLLPRLAHP
ncbi:MAG: nucleoside hydrolase [Acidobacteria bacterium]|nr:MAG: nucleoside hydrolase [Acidobacteriota bacterium]